MASNQRLQFELGVLLSSPKSKRFNNFFSLLGRARSDKTGCLSSSQTRTRREFELVGGSSSTTHSSSSLPHDRIIGPVSAYLYIYAGEFVDCWSSKKWNVTFVYLTKSWRRASFGNSFSFCVSFKLWCCFKERCGYFSSCPPSHACVKNMCPFCNQRHLLISSPRHNIPPSSTFYGHPAQQSQNSKWMSG